MQRSVAIQIWRFLVALWATTVGVYPLSADAAPETWIVPSVTLEGTTAGARFGDTIACSVASAATNNRSFVAVGAPEASNGRGAVYLFDPSNSSAPYQTITLDPGTENGHFGAGIAFIHDIPGSSDPAQDGLDDLVIGEPGTGTVHFYESSLDGQGRVTYTFCSSATRSNSTFGEKLLGIRGPWALPTPPIAEHVVVAAPSATNSDDLGVFALNLGAVCPGPASFHERYTANLKTTFYGSALAEINGVTSLADSGENEVNPISDVLVGHPNFVLDTTGAVRFLDSYLTLPPADREKTVRQVAEANYGAAIGGYHASTFFAIASPGRDGKGAVDIHDGAAATTVACSVQPSEASSTNFGQALAHLYQNFDNFFSGNTDATFAAYRSESTTGGSVGLFSIFLGACSSIYQINNCVLDANQEQGKTLEGADTCAIKPGGGAAQKMLLIGSPGWSSDKGRVDIVVPDNKLDAPQACGTSPTPTPIPPTPTPQPSAGEPEPTPAPTSIPVQPGSAVPAATVEISGSTVVFVLPELQPTLSAAQRKKALSLLAKKKIKGPKAESALNDLTLMFEVTVISTSSKKSFTVQATSDLIPFASASKKRQYKSRLNRVSAPKLPPGNYTATWKATIYTKKPSLALGTTKTSPPTKFTK